jgi:hypothetical protein
MEPGAVRDAGAAASRGAAPSGRPLNT